MLIFLAKMVRGDMGYSDHRIIRHKLVSRKTGIVNALIRRHWVRTSVFSGTQPKWCDLSKSI